MINTLPVVSYTHLLFQQIHADVMIMGTPCNGYNKVVDSQDFLSHWLEGRPIKEGNARISGMFLLEDMI